MPKAKTTKTTSKTKEDLVKENKELQGKNKELETQVKSIVSEVDTVKETMKQILAEYEKLKVEKDKEIETLKTNVVKNDINDLGEFDDIGPRYRVKTTSLYHGGLNLKGLHTDIRYEKFGQSRVLNFEDVEAISSNNRSFLEQGLLYIHDDRVLKLVYLDDDKINKLIEPNVLKRIFELPVDRIESLYKSTTKDLKKEILNTFAEWINKNDPYYLDKNKIDAINEISGKDVKKIAEAIKEYED